MQSLKDIAIAYGVTPQAALNWKVAAEKRTGRSLTAHPDPTDKRRVLYSASDVADITQGKQPKTSTPEPAPEPAEITVLEGNHREVLAAPVVPTSIDLGRFRGDSQIAAYANPLETINGALSLIRTAQQAMGQDLAIRVDLYRQTDNAVVQLEAEAKELQATQIRYQVETDLLGILQNQKTAELQRHLGKVQALGGGEV